VSHPREICANCHFLAARTIHPQGVPPNCLSEEERAPLRAGDFSIVGTSNNVILHCHLRVWSTPVAAGQDNVVKYLAPQIRREIFETDRREFCFYMAHHPGMALDAGATLEKRKSEARETKREHKIALWGLWIAALALVAQNVWTAIDFVITAPNPREPAGVIRHQATPDRAGRSWRKCCGPVTLHCSRSRPRGILAVHSVPTTTQPEQAGAKIVGFTPRIHVVGRSGRFHWGNAVHCGEDLRQVQHPGKTAFSAELSRFFMACPGKCLPNELILQPSEFEKSLVFKRDFDFLKMFTAVVS
jgi:hypothetical protein